LLTTKILVTVVIVVVFIRGTVIDVWWLKAVLPNDALMTMPMAADVWYLTNMEQQERRVEAKSLFALISLDTE
jgi:hypothetical protein